jgi:hypothetical protein
MTPWLSAIRADRMRRERGEIDPHTKPTYSGARPPLSAFVSEHSGLGCRHTADHPGRQYSSFAFCSGQSRVVVKSAIETQQEVQAPAGRLRPPHGSDSPPAETAQSPIPHSPRLDASSRDPVGASLR